MVRVLYEIIIITFINTRVRLYIIATGRRGGGTNGKMVNPLIKKKKKKKWPLAVKSSVIV